MAITTYESYTNLSNVSSQEIKDTQNYGQTFSHNSGSGTYKVNRIQLRLKADSEATSQTITVQIRASWSGTILRSGTIGSSTLSTSATWETIELTANVTLTDSTTYMIRVTSDTASGKIYLDKGGAGTYSNGTFYDKDGSSVPGDDMFFYVEYDSALYGWSSGKINTVLNDNIGKVHGVNKSTIGSVNTV